MPETNSAPSETLQLPVEVIGADSSGQQFLEPARTFTIHRNGVSIFMDTDVAQDSEVIVRNPETGEEAIAYMIGQKREYKGGDVYGFGFVDPTANPWHLHLSSGGGTKEIELQCSTCHSVQRHTLLATEFESFRVSRESICFCNTCNAAKIWRAPGAATAADFQDISLPDSSDASVGERRRNKRTSMKTVACIRFSGRDIVVECEDVSKGGFRFTSRKEFPTGTRIEAAVPYTKSSTNIFCVSGIIFCHKMPDGQFRHGVTYVRNRGSVGWGE